jgi:chaperonin 10 Kd subunit
MTNLELTRIKVLVKRDTMDTTFLTVEGNLKETGTIIAVGKDCEHLQPGDRVWLGHRTGVKLNYEGEEVELMDEDEVLGKILS